MPELGDYKLDVSNAVQIDFTSQSGTLCDTINELFEDADGFAIEGLEKDQINNWFDNLECGTWKDLIDWLWGILIDLWEKYFG